MALRTTEFNLPYSPQSSLLLLVRETTQPMVVALEKHDKGGNRYGLDMELPAETIHQWCGEAKL